MLKITYGITHDWQLPEYISRGSQAEQESIRILAGSRLTLDLTGFQDTLNKLRSFNQNHNFRQMGIGENESPIGPILALVQYRLLGYPIQTYTELLDIVSTVHGWNLQPPKVD